MEEEKHGMGTAQNEKKSMYTERSLPALVGLQVLAPRALQRALSAS